MRLLVTTLSLLVLLVPSFASAQELSPGDPCSTNDAVTRIGGPGTPNAYILKCNGTTWQSMINLPNIAGDLEITGRIISAMGATDGQVLKWNNAAGEWQAGNDQSGGGSLSDGDYGDITLSGSGATWTIDNSVVTFAKMQDMNQYTVIGRMAAGSGAPSQITAAGLIALLENGTATASLADGLNADLLDGMTSTDFVAVAGDTMTGDLAIQIANVGIPSAQGNLVLENADFHVDVISSSADTWGSSVNLIEGNGASNTDIWSMYRQTTGGTGNSSLHFKFGTNNTPSSNTSVVTISSAGAVSATSFSGDGSGLTGISADDADTLDGMDSLDFVAVAGDQMTGLLDVSHGGGDTARFTNPGSGNASIVVESDGAGNYAQIAFDTDNANAQNDAYLIAYGTTAGQPSEISLKNRYGDITFYPGSGSPTRVMGIDTAGADITGSLSITSTISDPDSYLHIPDQLRVDSADTTWDIWLQGGGGSGDDRNLAMIGRDEDSGDYLLINYNGEYASGVGIGMTTDPQGALDVNGAVYATSFNGSGAGLTGVTATNADTVDSLHAASFLRSDADDSVSSSSNQIRFPSAAAMESTSGSQASLEVYQGTSTADAFMTFHISGAHARYFGVDRDTNDLATGGWSAGAVKHRIWHAGNDGPTSGLAAQTAATASDLSCTNCIGTTEIADSYVLNSGDTMTGNLVNNAHIYGRSVNGQYSHLYRFGGLFFTWDSDSYGTNFEHSITSTDNGTYGDDITLNSYGNVRINIDSNNNGTNVFQIGNANTGTANTRLTLDESGNLSISGTMSGDSITDGTIDASELAADSVGNSELINNPTVNDLYIDDGNTRIHHGSGNAVRIQTNSGYVDIGPQNTSYAHFTTDRADFYFNKDIHVNGGIVFYNSDDGLDNAGGDYGSVTTVGSGNGSYEGYSISNRSVFMHDGSNVTGIYNDVDNEWFWYANRNAELRLFHNGTERMRTSTIGIDMRDGDVHNVRYVRYDSDERKKKDIVVLDSALEKISQIKGVSYVWRDEFASEQSKGKTHIGVIAQDVEKVFPELVHADEEGYKDVAYQHLVSPLIEAVKELWGHVQGNTSRIDALEQEIEVLKAQNAELLEHIKSTQ